MLTKPCHGWTELRLEDRVYPLSYLTDIPMEWLDRAIFGLESGQPFTVRAQLEPETLTCVVSEAGCLVNDVEWYRFGMADFCRALHDDLSACPEDWAAFGYHGPAPERKRDLCKKLQRLEVLLK